MTLDLLKVGPRVAEMARDAADRGGWHRARLTESREIVRRLAGSWEELAEIAIGTADRRLPKPLEPLDTHVAAPSVPRDHVVIATDGSQIEPDRHGVGDYFLINVGWAVVRYGEEPFAELSSQPRLYYGPDETYITHITAQSTRRVPIQDRHLSAKRSVEELKQAANLTTEWNDAGLPLTVLADGTLALWVLEERPGDFLRKALVEPYVEQLQRIRDLDRPLASYVSRPRANDVSALLHAGGCSGLLDGCSGLLDGCEACATVADELCIFDHLADRDLFGWLAPGERSALFEMTLPAGLTEFYGDLVPRFFYLNVGSEIARVEVPPWTAEDPAHLGQVQAVILDQCDKGLGYPNVLARADKQAVVTVQDRQAFAYLHDALLAREGVQPRTSEKLHSKRVWAV
ncbi:MAG TPA: DNA double-strand break repair nuclease NurA [Chloroflexota bacterium]|nr:DNA double-strand break repair nuclease NurA [Chloroflexota bacterium]